ncbi:hypothetical protein BGZ81_004704 [Podila clonocystis]|nr:hypothetical protein BGZ81_004704 [Podila clonocystis]
MILSICGAVNCRMEMLTPEDELVAPTREQYKEETLRRCRGRRYRESTIGLEEYIAIRNPYGGNHDIDDNASQSVPIHEDDLVTLSMVDATMSLDESSDNIQESFYSQDHFDDPLRFNGPPDRKHLLLSDSDTPSTLQYDRTPPSDPDATQQQGDFREEIGESSESRHAPVNFSDAPTQILDPSEHPTFTYDASIDSEHALHSSVEHIAAVTEIVETTQPSGPPEVADDAPTQIQDFGTYLPEIISNTQSTQEITSTLSLSRSSRPGSVEPVSQELSQVYPLHMAEHLHSTATRIPSTPVDILNERSSSKDPEDIQESISERHEDDSVSIIPHTQEEPVEGSLEQSTLDIARLSGPSTASAASMEPMGETEHELTDLSGSLSPPQPSPELPVDSQESNMPPPPLPGTPVETEPEATTQQDENSPSQRTMSPPAERSQLLSRGTYHGRGYENIIKQLQWTKSDDDFSVLVFSSTSRTVKFMTAIVKGVPIVSTSWLDECYKQKRFISFK